MRRLRSSSWLLCVLLCACDCHGRSAPAKREQPQAQTQLPPSPPGTPVAAERLRQFFPDTIAGYVAPAAAEPQTMPIATGGTWTIMRRKYEQGPKTLTLEVSDVLHAPGARRVIESQQGAIRSNDKATFRGAPIAGQPALIQWQGEMRTAIVNILVGGRILVTVKVDPANDEEPAAVVARALPLDQFAQLALAASAEESVGGARPSDMKPAAPPAPSAPGAQPAATKP